MNLVEMNTASVNNKIAEEYQNGILQDGAWDIKAAEILSAMDSASENGRKTEVFPSGSAKWKNQQGMSLKEFLEKKGYTVSEHYRFNYMRMMFVGFGKTELKRLEEMIQIYSNKYSYDGYTMVSSSGVVGTSLEEAKSEKLEPLYKELQELQKDNSKTIKDNTKKNIPSNEENCVDNDDNSQFILFVIVVLAILAGVFLMFN